MRRIAQTIAAVAIVCAGAEARAHLNLTQPTSRYGKYTLKSPPCGKGDGPRSTDVVTYRAGETIEVVWNEYIDHPGHYRIAFDADGQDDFAPPECTAGCETRQPEFRGDVNAAVLVDDIADKRGGTYRKEVTLPEVTCENCTLQVIQVMYDKPPYSVPGNDLYYQCADLELVGGSGDAGGGGDTGSDADVGGIDTGPGDTGVGSDGGMSDGGDTAVDSGTAPTDTVTAADDTDDGDAAAKTESGCGVVAGQEGRPAFSSLPFFVLILVATGWHRRTQDPRVAT